MKKRAPTLFWIAALAISVLILPATPVLKAPAAASNGPMQPKPGGPIHHSAPAPPVLFVEAWAVVAFDGTLVRQSGDVVSSQRFGAGSGAYEVIFDDNVRDCAYIATTGDPGSTITPPSGQIGVVGRDGDVNGVFIQTYGGTGAPVDRGFHLLVTC